MRKAIFIVLTLILIIGITIHFFNQQNVLETHKSPDGKYEVIIKSNRSFFESTMPGDRGKSTSVDVILKDVNGKIIGKSSNNSNCDTLWFSIYIEWDVKNNQVWYAKSKTINLITGKVEC
jgi:hypothetical protein